MAEEKKKNLPTLKEELEQGVQIGKVIIKEVSQEWFTMAQLYSQSKHTQPQVDGMLSHLQAFGMLDMKQEKDNTRYKVCTSIEERDRIVRDAKARMVNDMQGLEYGIKRLDNILKINPWNVLTSVN